MTSIFDIPEPRSVKLELTTSVMKLTVSALELCSLSTSDRVCVLYEGSTFEEDRFEVGMEVVSDDGVGHVFNVFGQFAWVGYNYPWNQSVKSGGCSGGGCSGGGCSQDDSCDCGGSCGGSCDDCKCKEPEGTECRNCGFVDPYADPDDDGKCLCWKCCG